MSCGYGGSSSMMGAQYGGQGYSYATLTSSMDPADTDFSRRQSAGCSGRTGRPRVDRRYSPPPRRRADAGPSSSVYASLHSGLTFPRTAITKSALHATASTHRRADTSAHAKSDAHRSHHAKSPAKQQHRPKKEHKHKPRPEKKPLSRKSTASKKSADDKGRTRRYSMGSSRSKSTARSRLTSLGSRKAASQKSKGKSKSMFSWGGCFGS